MSNKYNEVISKIEASEELKNTIIKKMEKEQLKKNGGFIIEIKKIITAIMSLLGLMACGGFVYATVSGMLDINGILFSDEFINYQDTVENQYVEKDGTKVELVSKICDEGFLVLQFEIELSDSIVKQEDDCLAYLSFNDKLQENEDGSKYLWLTGANYNLLIDGKKHWLRGSVENQIIENIRNKNYTVYQLYFLPSEEIENKEKFTVTLDDIIIAINHDEPKYIEMDGKFEIEVSKEKALQDTTTIKNNDSSIIYERLTHKVEKVTQTPMQTVIKMSSLTIDATLRNSTYLLAEDYIGNLEYKVYDQNNNELFTYTSISGYEFTYNDGTTKKFSTSDIEGAAGYGYNKIFMEEYIVTEKNEDITSLRIEVYEINSYYGTSRNIGTHFIDLEKQKIVSENKNEVIKTSEGYVGRTQQITVNDIKYFDIEFDQEYDMSYTYYKFKKELKENSENEWYLKYEYDDVNEENATMIEYYISMWEKPEQVFQIILFRDKSLFDIYCEVNNHASIIVIDENDEYKLAVKIELETLHIDDIKDVTDTIKLKEAIITQQEAKKILEDLYYDARWKYLGAEFEYKKEEETIEYINNRNEKIETEAVQITNYDEILNQVFTENGKKQYKINNDVQTGGKLVYLEEKVYDSGIGYCADEYHGIEIINIEIEKNKISSTVRHMYSDGRETIEHNFIIKKINGKWLVDEYTNVWF